MFEFFAALATLGFAAWAVILLGLIAIVVGVENERYSLSTVALLIGGSLLVFLTGGTFGGVYHSIADNLDKVVNVVLLYAGIGIAWGVVKWFFYLMRVRDALVAYRKENDITGPLTDKQKSDFKSYNRSIVGYSQEIPPRASDNKGRVTYWMIWWPFSMPWTLINEPVKRFFNFVYYRIAGLLQGMSDRLFKGIA